MPPQNKWTTDNIPDSEGKIILITGANSGLGFETAQAIAAKKATVVMACRNPAKGEKAVENIHSLFPDAKIALMDLDLSSLKSINMFAEKFKNAYDYIDILINNAGVMAPPYSTTEDGFELQIGINHFGHFALTGLLLDLLLQAETGRIVSVSSFAHKMGAINFHDINWKKKYSKWPAYSQSKLANLLFTYELDRRLKNVNARAIAVAAHPGYSHTKLQRYTGLFSFLNHIIAQPPHMGALPILYAATAWNIGGGHFIGPDGFLEMRGYPKKTHSNKKSFNQDVARRLWELSEKVTGVKYRFKKE